MTNKEIAQKTKQYLMDYGWYNLANPSCKDSKPIGGSCIALAANKATLLDGEQLIPFWNALLVKMGHEVNHSRCDISPIFNWNDSQTSVEAIYNLLDSIEE